MSAVTRTVEIEVAVIGGMDGPKGHEVIQALTQIMHHYDGQISTAEQVAAAKWFAEVYGSGAVP